MARRADQVACLVDRFFRLRWAGSAAEYVGQVAVALWDARWSLCDEPGDSWAASGGPSRSLEQWAVVGVEYVASPSAQHQVANEGWQVARAIPAVGLGADPFIAGVASGFEAGYRLRYS